MNTGTSLIKAHSEICTQLHDTFQRKNADYGGAYSKLRAEFPETILIHLTEKLERLKSLFHHPAQVNESIDDTLLDLANYAIMELAERNVAKIEMTENQQHKVAYREPSFVPLPKAPAEWQQPLEITCESNVTNGPQAADPFNGGDLLIGPCNAEDVPAGCIRVQIPVVRYSNGEPEKISTNAFSGCTQEMFGTYTDEWPDPDETIVSKKKGKKK